MSKTGRLARGAYLAKDDAVHDEQTFPGPLVLPGDHIAENPREKGQLMDVSLGKMFIALEATMPWGDSWNSDMELQYLSWLPASLYPSQLQRLSRSLRNPTRPRKRTPWKRERLSSCPQRQVIERCLPITTMSHTLNLSPLILPPDETSTILSSTGKAFAENQEVLAHTEARSLIAVYFPHQSGTYCESAAVNWHLRHGADPDETLTEAVMMTMPEAPLALAFRRNHELLENVISCRSILGTHPESGHSIEAEGQHTLSQIECARLADILYPHFIAADALWDIDEEEKRVTGLVDKDLPREAHEKYAWLTKSKEIITGNLPNLKGENVIKTNLNDIVSLYTGNSFGLKIGNRNVHTLFAQPKPRPRLPYKGGMQHDTSRPRWLKDISAVLDMCEDPDMFRTHIASYLSPLTFHHLQLLLAFLTAAEETTDGFRSRFAFVPLHFGGPGILSMEKGQGRLIGPRADVMTYPSNDKRRMRKDYIVYRAYHCISFAIDAYGGIDGPNRNAYVKKLHTNDDHLAC
ncbi:hypothetical protein FAGAP_9526 [Fusarium agapanthi]|uniref:Uncharacterized protein n=1 Tax=Fusarium agapanthi TaxID=1803897 RepID=A0A9P5E911_9HYPO|nr:hypothetical protein FAGAP_9526 [Fusarium agapanthi]